MHRLCLLAPFTTLLLNFASANPHAKAARHAHAQGAQVFTTLTTNPSPVSSAGSANPSASGSSTGTGGGSGAVNLPQGCLTTANGAIGIGFDVGYGDAEAADSPTASQLVIAGKNPCVIGRFVDVDGTSDDYAVGLSDANQMNSIYMISLTLNVGGANGATVAGLVNNVAKTAKNDVWLRLGYEMDTKGYPYDSGAFKTLWTAVAGAVNRDKVKMYWCPTNAGGSSSTFYPDNPSEVDIAGVDSYPVSGNSVLGYGLTQEFCQTYGNHDLWVGEFGQHPNAQAPSQAQWFAQGACPDITSWCPSYKGFCWSEFDDKTNGDFRAVTDGAAAQGYQTDLSGNCKTSP